MGWNIHIFPRLARKKLEGRRSILRAIPLTWLITCCVTIFDTVLSDVDSSGLIRAQSPAVTTGQETHDHAPAGHVTGQATRYWVEDFESNISKPAPLNRPKLFHRTHRQSAGGHFSLVLDLPVRGTGNGPIAGGDIMKLVLPTRNSDLYKISVKTYLKRIDQGRLIFRAKFVKVIHHSWGEIDETKETIFLGDIEDVEEGWTTHEFIRSFSKDGVDPDTSYMTVYAAIDSLDDTKPAGGLVYIDDITYQTLSGIVNPNEFQLDFENKVLLPSYLEESINFSCQRDPAALGNTSLLLEAPRVNQPKNTLIGGDIARVKIPDGADLLQISMKSWPEELEESRLILRTVFLDLHGQKTSAITTADILEPGGGWTDHHFDYPLRFVAAGADVAHFYAALQSVSGFPARGRAWFDDIRMNFRIQGEASDDLMMDFENRYAMPPHLENSRNFIRTNEKSASGEYSIYIQPSGAGGAAGRFVGGDVVKTDIPQDMAGYRITLKTWLGELNTSLLMLRAVFFDGSGEKLVSIVLDDVSGTEEGWTDRQYERHLSEGGEEAKSLAFYVALKIAMNGTPSTRVYLDDLKIEFFGGETDPCLLQLGFNDGSTLPDYLVRPGKFLHILDENSSGEGYLELNKLPPGEVADTIIGGEIARMHVPPDYDVLTLSMNTWLKKTGSGQLNLWADFMDHPGAQVFKIPLADVTGEGTDWTGHRFERRLPVRDPDTTATLVVYAGIDESMPLPAHSAVCLDDIELRLHGPNPEPLALDADSDDPFYLQCNFDTQYYLPPWVEQSGVFALSQEEASSGDTSLLLRASLLDGSSSKYVGGDVVRIDIPEGSGMIYDISLKTRLQDLNLGALVLREQFFDSGGNIIMEIPVKHIRKPERAWTLHRHKGLLSRYNLHKNAKAIGIHVGLDSQSIEPVEGTAYIDDVEILFH